MELWVRKGSPVHIRLLLQKKNSLKTSTLSLSMTLRCRWVIERNAASCLPLDIYIYIWSKKLTYIWTIIDNALNLTNLYVVCLLLAKIFIACLFLEHCLLLLHYLCLSQWLTLLMIPTLSLYLVRTAFDTYITCVCGPHCLWYISYLYVWSTLLMILTLPVSVISTAYDTYM